MSHPYFLLKTVGGQPYLECRGPDFEFAPSDRKLSEADLENFERWVRAYHREVPGHEAARHLLALGVELREWLDHGNNWFAELKQNSTQQPFIVEFRIDRGQSEPFMGHFLESPWELLADPHGGHLAADPKLLYCPVRRIGRPCAGGNKEEGLEILQRSQKGFTRLGQPHLARQIEQWIIQIKSSQE